MRKDIAKIDVWELPWEFDKRIALKIGKEMRFIIRPCMIACPLNVCRRIEIGTYTGIAVERPRRSRDLSEVHLLAYAIFPL